MENKKEAVRRSKGHEISPDKARSMISKASHYELEMFLAFTQVFHDLKIHKSSGGGGLHTAGLDTTRGFASGSRR